MHHTSNTEYSNINEDWIYCRPVGSPNKLASEGIFYICLLQPTTCFLYTASGYNTIKGNNKKKGFNIICIFLDKFPQN